MPVLGLRSINKGPKKEIRKLSHFARKSTRFNNIVNDTVL